MGGQKLPELLTAKSIDFASGSVDSVWNGLWLSESQTRILDFGLADAVLFYFLIKGASWYSQPPGRYLYPPAFFF
jgi:hypothetical protein